MNIDSTFLPVAVELIDKVFPTDIKYIRDNGPTYDPATGEVTQDTTEYDIKAGILSRGRTEQGGIGETYEIQLWIHHDTDGLTELPRTGDVIEYDSTRWKVSSIDPTYSSKDLIASKIVARAS